MPRENSRGSARGSASENSFFGAHRRGEGASEQRGTGGEADSQEERVREERRQGGRAAGGGVTLWGGGDEALSVEEMAAFQLALLLSSSGGDVARESSQVHKWQGLRERQTIDRIRTTSSRTST